MIQEKAKQRVKIPVFWDKHGTEAVEEVFGVKERTLYLWQRKLKNGEGKLEALNDTNRAPTELRRKGGSVCGTLAFSKNSSVYVKNIPISEKRNSTPFCFRFA